MQLVQVPCLCISQSIPGSLCLPGQVGHYGEMMMGSAKWYTKWLLCSISAWCWAHQLAGPIHVPCFQVCWLMRVLSDLQGALFCYVLTQLGRQVLLLLRVWFWPNPIILNPLSLIIAFRNVPQSQPRLGFLSASNGYTTSFNRYFVDLICTLLT